MSVAYSHINSRGVRYYLHSKVLQMKHHLQNFYFFAREADEARAVHRFPEGHYISESVVGRKPQVRKIKSV